MAKDTQQIEVHEVLKGYVVETNSDLTEGRGYQYPMNGTVTLNKYTAIRLAEGKGIQGFSADVEAVTLFRYYGRLYGPVSLIEPREEEKRMEKEAIEEAKKLALKTELLARLEKLGVTASELALLK